jgi:hypothetical protein
MPRTLTSVGPPSNLPTKDAPDYMEKLLAWAEADTKADQALWDHLSLLVYAAQATALRPACPEPCCYLDGAALDAAIDAVLDAMPAYGKARFDALMQK